MVLHRPVELARLTDISNNVGSVKSFFERTSPFTPVSGLPGYLRPLHRRPRLVRNLSIGFSPTQTSLRSVLRPRLLIQTPFAGSGMPNQVDGVLLHTMSGTELSTYEPHSNDGEYSQPFRHIQYRRTARRRPIATWQCSCADASPGAGTDVASPAGYALLLGLPPPTRSATRNCLAC